jgi:hypothetical protein
VAALFGDEYAVCVGGGEALWGQTRRGLTR